MKFIITEKTDINATRAGSAIEAKDLRAAKAAASRAQLFQNTVITVANESGVVLAVKQNGKWA
jgi:hypothetical protein